MTESDDSTQPARLIQPPRLRTGEDRTASRLELFFDLAYVLVVAELTGAFGDDLTWHGAMVFVGLFTVTWWSWVTTTLYANRFDTNDVPYRLAKLGQTFAVAVMAAAASKATGSDARYFVFGYIATRLILILLYVRAYRHVAEARRTLAFYLGGAVTGAALWAVSLAVPGPTRYVLWAAGVLIEALAPLLATRFGGDVPLHEEHLPERFGLFAILVLGESIASVVDGMHDTGFRVASLASAVTGFVITAALWWTYFDLGGAAGKQNLLDDQRQVSSTHDRYVYGHLPLLLGLAIASIGIEEYILHPTGGMSTAGRWTLCAGAALFLTGVVLVMAGTASSWSASWPWPMLFVPVLLGLGAFSAVPPTAVAIGVACTLVLTVLTGIRQQRRGRLATTET